MSSLSFGWRGLLAPIALVAALTAPSSAQARRLSAPLPRPGAADVLSDYALTADGARVVYRCDVLQDEAFALFSQRADAAAPPVRLSATLGSGGDVTSFLLAGARVVYLADQDVDEVFELYGVPVTGGTPVKLSPALAPAGDVLSYRVTADGQTAVFLVDTGTAKRFYRTPVDGSAPPLLLDASPAAGAPGLWWLAPDASRLLFTRRVFSGPFGYYFDHLDSLPLDGGGADVELAVAHDTTGVALGPYGSAISALEFSPDGTRAVYTDRVDGKDGGEEYLLHVVPIDGSGTPVTLSLGVANYGLVSAVSPTVDRVVVLEGNGYTLRLDGTGSVPLGLPGLIPESLMGFTPDGQTVLYTVHNPVRSEYALVAARLDGATPPRALDGPRAAFYQDVRISADRVAFVARDGVFPAFFGFRGFYSVPLDASAPARLLNGPALERTGAGGQISRTPTGLLVFHNSYTATADTELFVVPEDGSLSPRRICEPMSNGRDAIGHVLAPDGQGVIYLADQHVEGNFELYRTSVVGPAAPVPFLTLPAGPTVGDVISFRASADGRSVVFLADQETDEEFRVYHVPASGRAAPTRVGNFSFLNAQIELALSPFEERVVEYRSTSNSFLYTVGWQPGGSEIDVAYGKVLGPLLFSPDGRYLIFRRSQIGSGSELVRATFDGVDPLSLLRVGSRDVKAFRITRDQRYVLTLAEITAARRFEIYRVPFEGGPAVRLHAPIANNRAVEDYAISPDETQVVFRCDVRVNNDLELFVVPLEGLDAPPRRLNGDVLDYALSPDGRRVVYRADARIDGRAELFSVPLAPSVPGHGRPTGGDDEPDVVALTVLETGTGVEDDWRIAPDGRQVFFRAALGGGATRLWRVPLDGSAAPSPVGAADAGAVVSFLLSPDKARVVWLAEKPAPLHHRLFSASTQGGPAVDLDPLPPQARISRTFLTPDSRHVVYLCDREATSTDELFRVAIDGSSAPEVLSEPFPPGGTVVDVEVLADGRIVYRADQETDEVFELYTVPPAPRVH